MKKHKTTHNRFDEIQGKKSKEFRKECDLDTDEMSMVDDMATITAVIHRLMWMLNQAPNEVRKDFGKKLFRLKEQIDERFPITLENGSCIEEMCPLCLADEEGTCTHRQHVRAAIMLCGMFRIHPKVDLDEPTDEIPDTNEGMVSS